MKVIIQDIRSGEYLSENGQWVATEAEARDFFTLLRAYHFAHQNITGRFQVLLYCEEDQYSACIIEGVGTADFKAETSSATVQTQTIEFVRKTNAPVRAMWSRAIRFDCTANPLN
jgi:hypothetical protein